MSLLRKFKFETSGNVATIFAILALPLMYSAGISVDYSRLYSAKSQAQQAADAAALASTQEYDLSDRKLKRFAKKFLKANYPELSNYEKFDITVKRDKEQVVHVSLEGVLPSTFMKVAGFPNMNITVKAAANSSRGFQDIYIMMDRSASLLIADGDKAIADLKAFTNPLIQSSREPSSQWAKKSEPDGCAFACHYIPSNTSSMAWAPDDKTLIETAKDAGIPLRRDRVENSANLMVDEMLISSAGKIRFGILDFAYNAQLTLEPTNNKSSVVRKINEFNSSIEMSATDYPGAFRTLESKIGNQGNGASQSNAKKLIVLITDGLYTYWGNPGGDTQPFKSEFCDSLKAKGFKFGVINIIYDLIPNSAYVKKDVAPIRDSSVADMKSCAASDMYFEANDPDTIEKAFKDMAVAILKRTPRLLY